ncbi:MAG: leucine-rich repeat domain-containing protein [Nitrospira sp.]|nr:leucine-rich repeat domain-containing protein [Nitrospira sp.]
MDGILIARRLIAEEREKKTGFLDLGNLGLTEVPVELFELTHLRGLNLGTHYVDEQGEYHRSSNGDEDNSNRLRALPAALKALANLVSLSIHGNPIEDLGPLQACTALQQLDCWNTQVSDLGPLQACTALQQLNCWNTQVSDLSPLQACTALQQLDCAGTQVTDLGPLQACTALQQLDCAGTQVTDLGPLVSILSLQKLTVNGCQLKDLPRQLLFQESLRELILHEVTIGGIPPEVLSADESSSCLMLIRLTQQAARGSICQSFPKTIDHKILWSAETTG